MWFDYDAKCNIEYGIYLIGQSGDEGECMTKDFWHRSKKNTQNYEILGNHKRKDNLLF